MATRSAIRYVANILVTEKRPGLDVSRVSWDDADRKLTPSGEYTAIDKLIADITWIGEEKGEPLMIGRSMMMPIVKPAPELVGGDPRASANMQDLAFVVDGNKITLKTGNERGDVLREITVVDYLSANGLYKPDEPLVATAQVSPVPTGANISPAIYPYFADILVIVSWAGGSTVIIAPRGKWTVLYHNENGTKHSFSAETLSASREKRGVPLDAQITPEEKGFESVTLYLVPIKEIPEEYAVRVVHLDTDEENYGDIDEYAGAGCGLQAKGGGYGLQAKGGGGGGGGGGGFRAKGGRYIGEIGSRPVGAGTVPVGAGTVPAGAGTVPAGAGTVPAGAGTVQMAQLEKGGRLGPTAQLLPNRFTRSYGTLRAVHMLWVAVDHKTVDKETVLPDEFFEKISQELVGLYRSGIGFGSYMHAQKPREKPRPMLAQKYAQEKKTRGQARDLIQYDEKADEVIEQLEKVRAVYEKTMSVISSGVLPKACEEKLLETVSVSYSESGDRSVIRIREEDDVQEYAIAASVTRIRAFFMMYALGTVYSHEKDGPKLSPDYVSMLLIDERLANALAGTLLTDKWSTKYSIRDADPFTVKNDWHMVHMMVTGGHYYDEM